MAGELLYGADGSLVYGDASSRLLYKPRDAVTVTASAIQAFMGSVSDDGWSSTKYYQTRSDAEADFLADSVLGGASMHDVVNGLATSYGYGPYVWNKRYGLRLTFSLSSTVKSRLSSIAISSIYVCWWLKGERYVTGTYREIQDLFSTGGSICWLLTDQATPFANGAALASETPDLAVSWNTLNADQVAAGSTVLSTQYLHYPLPGTAVDRVKAYPGTTLYLWVWANATSLPYLGDQSAAFQVGTSGTYGWEIICGPVNSTPFAPLTPLLKLRLGQDG